MSERDELETTEAAEQEMEREADDMQTGVERLEAHIEQAEEAARERPEVNDDSAGDSDDED